MRLTSLWILLLSYSTIGTALHRAYSLISSSLIAWRQILCANFASPIVMCVVIANVRDCIVWNGDVNKPWWLAIASYISWCAELLEIILASLTSGINGGLSSCISSLTG